MTTLYTIGFTQSSAAHFFGRLRDVGIGRLLDIRLNNRSQLAGFAKAGDVELFLRELVGADYEHRTDLAPTAEMLKAYRSKAIDWAGYAEQFSALLVERRIEDLDRTPFDGPSVLLCSEASPERCHRRLVAEHLSSAWPALSIEHL